MRIELIRCIGNRQERSSFLFCSQTLSYNLKKYYFRNVILQE